MSFIHAMHQRPSLVPELDVSNLAESREFYVDAVGFEELYRRRADPEPVISRVTDLGSADCCR